MLRRPVQSAVRAAVRVVDEPGDGRGAEHLVEADVAIERDGAVDVAGEQNDLECVEVARAARSPRDCSRADAVTIVPQACPPRRCPGRAGRPGRYGSPSCSPPSIALTLPVPAITRSKRAPAARTACPIRDIRSSKLCPLRQDAARCRSGGKREQPSRPPREATGRVNRYQVRTDGRARAGGRHDRTARSEVVSVTWRSRTGRRVGTVAAASRRG